MIENAGEIFSVFISVAKTTKSFLDRVLVTRDFGLLKFGHKVIGDLNQNPCDQNTMKK